MNSKVFFVVVLSNLAVSVLCQRSRFGGGNGNPVAIGRQNDAADDCPEDQISFEMISGYVYTAPADMLDSQPGTLMLTTCIDKCKANSTCKSINYETGLCVLFASSADENAGELAPSQFPVFTIYVQKNCFPSASLCNAAWSYERVMQHKLDLQPTTRTERENRQECMELCLQDPECKAINWDIETKECSMLNRDRHELAGQPLFQPQQGVDYVEKNCIDASEKRLCIYEQVKGKILKTVDSVYQAIDSREDCEDLCNNAPYRCHSYDFNDTGDNVCRLSHHSAHTLTQIEDPYLAIEEATTYELTACYNVSIDCFSGDMRANIHTNTLFSGKVYAKGSPLTCVEDIQQTLDFSITFGYTDLDCGVERLREGSYTNDIIIQHHDSIVTSKDIGLSVTCEYDLSNKTVANMVDLKITGEITPSIYEESVVDSPNVIMRVADSQGQDTKTAVVGDSLSMVFEILDNDSPYEIFVRDLIAMDGATDTELLLIDGRGCPVEPTIMSELRKSSQSPKLLLSSFDAFRFPSSDMVQFRALITPCMPTCAPVTCDILDYTGQTRNVESYGRKKRALEKWLPASNTSLTHRRQKRTTEPEEVMLMQTLRIVDKYGRRRGQQTPEATDNAILTNTISINEQPYLSTSDSLPSQVSGYDTGSEAFDFSERENEKTRSSDRCIDENSLIAGAVVFLAAQILLLVLWVVLWKKKRSQNAKEVVIPDNSADSLSYMYESGFSRRMQ